MTVAPVKQVVVVIPDPTEDAYIPIARVPANHQWTFEAAYAIASKAVASATDAYINLSLMNGGTDGAQTDLISDAIGGTDGWAVNTAKAFTIVDGSGKLTAGQYLVVFYNETGTVAPLPITVIVDYVDGIGEKANA